MELSINKQNVRTSGTEFQKHVDWLYSQIQSKTKMIDGLSIGSQNKKQRVCKSGSDFQKNFDKICAEIEEKDKMIDDLLDQMEAEFGRPKPRTDGRCMIVAISNKNYQ